MNRSGGLSLLGKAQTTYSEGGRYPGLMELVVKCESLSITMIISERGMH